LNQLWSWPSRRFVPQLRCRHARNKLKKLRVQSHINNNNNNSQSYNFIC
jgi:hypothetical protein